MKIMSLALKALSDGVKAYNDGKSLKNNPFPVSSMLYSHWKYGFRMAEAKKH